MSEPTQIAPLEFDDGTKVYVESWGSLRPAGGRSLVSAQDDIAQKFASVANVVKNVSKEIYEAAKAAGPAETEVEFSLAIKIEPDGITTMFVRGDASADLKIKLKWSAND